MKKESGDDYPNVPKGYERVGNGSKLGLKGSKEDSPPSFNLGISEGSKNVWHTVSNIKTKAEKNKAVRYLTTGTQVYNGSLE